MSVREMVSGFSSASSGRPAAMRPTKGREVVARAASMVAALAAEAAARSACFKRPRGA